MNLLIFLLFIPPLALVLLFSHPSALFWFFAASSIPFFTAKSRRVSDPVVGIPNNTELSPDDFHEWAYLVCSTEGYRKMFESYVYDSNKGYDEKLPLSFSQIKAINYYHANRVILFFLVVLNAYVIWNLFFFAPILREPVIHSVMVGIGWGYAFGLFNQKRLCGNRSRN